MKHLLLRLNPHGEPDAPGSGILLLPSQPYSSRSSQPIFTLTLLVSAATPVTNDGTIWCNAPQDTLVEYSREKFYAHPIGCSLRQDSLISMKLFRPGAYAFYASYLNNGLLTTTRKFYFVVQPTLALQGEHLPLNSVSVQSLVSKWMGPLSNWDKVLTHVADKGYNMVHFTPLQERGESNSPYSIYDQLSFDKSLFKNTQEVKDLVHGMREKHGLLSMTDVVWNHTANNSEWIRKHPDVGYSEDTAPHLSGAAALDEELLVFSKNLSSYGYSNTLNSVDDLLAVMEGIKSEVLAKVKLWEFSIVDTVSTIKHLRVYFEKSLGEVSVIDIEADSFDELVKYVVANAFPKPIQPRERFGNKIDLEKFASIVVSWSQKDEANASVDHLLEESKKILDAINLPLYKEYDADVAILLEQLFNRIKYLRIDDHGPKLGEITDKNPLTETYFTRFTNTDGKKVSLANNGWVWNGDPLIDFASNKSKAYLRREVIVWGDCVKLRYGKGPEDSPYLWKHMVEYTKLCAGIFDGFRIDNCHSTPIHVGETLIDAAREVNPNIYVVAELFSGSEQLDRLFVERLGISSLIREAMQAWSEQELSRIVHRYAGRPIGSLKWLPLDDFAYPKQGETFNNTPATSDKASEIDIPKLLTYQEPHGLFMDCTHDNETPSQKRTIEDTLPNAALVSLCSCAVGSVFGYDECYPKLLDIVNETRRYSFDKNTGISEVKHKLYAVRDEVSRESSSWDDNEMHVHHEGQYITLHRTNVKTGSGWFLVARMKFSENGGDQYLEPITLNGSTVKHEFSYALKRTGDPEKSEEYITSIPTQLEELPASSIEFHDNTSTIKLTGDFPPGSIAVFSTQYIGVDKKLNKFMISGAIEASENLNLYDLNAVLFKCDAEERDYSAGTEGVYSIPNHGKLVYAGLQGWISMLNMVIKENDLAHPFCTNVRDGNWALEYLSNRLEKYKTPGVEVFKKWLDLRIDLIKGLPFFLKPRYFALVIGIAYEACRLKSLALLSPLFQDGTLLIQDLGLTSLQMVGKNKSASLKPFEESASMAAGLPHFSYSYMRCWGRDIFIAFRGLLLATGRFDDAKQHILAAASTLKHGLIPNLIDSCRNPRYNARDATWFWLQSVQDYVNQVPGGEDILNVKIKRRFPLDDTYVPFDDPQAFSYESSLKDIIYEVFARHAKGIEFREANAGVNLDSQMKDEGFNQKIYVDWTNGIIFGGSQFNCGTWMDKMGESEKAHNKGVPGTPRDGAAVEITGLLKSGLRFINERADLFSEQLVITQDGKSVSFQQWDRILQDNFETSYYVPLEPEEDPKFDINPNVVNRRGMYKDVYKSGKEYEDYQLRPNFAIAMVVAPELFTPLRAVNALNLADKTIRGPVGMRTLDPSDYNYKPYYNNSEDSTDFATSKGRNYHQGPEWVWCIGYFLRAYAYFYFYEESVKGKLKQRVLEQLHRNLMKKLEGHKKWIKESPWNGLTELTNKDGEFCHDSSPTQAWSGACLIDLFLDLEKVDLKKIDMETIDDKFGNLLTK